MQNSLTQPCPLTSDSIIQFSPSTFSPSRRGAEWIADCSLKPFTFACGPWTARKYQICCICCLQNSLNGHSENAFPSRTHWRAHFRSIGTMMSSMMTLKRPINRSIIDNTTGKIKFHSTIVNFSRYIVKQRISYVNRIMKRSKGEKDIYRL